MLSYLMARETQHQLQFLKACEELEKNTVQLYHMVLKTYKNKVRSLHIHFATSQKEKLPVMETNSTIVVTPLWQVVNLI
ncbi:Mn-containing catalase [Limosilactobacillus fermentum]|nr:Mn-containing catalase [Limosilactobacillus fermentum]